MLAERHHHEHLAAAASHRRGERYDGPDVHAHVVAIDNNSNAFVQRLRHALRADLRTAAAGAPIDVPETVVVGRPSTRAGSISRSECHSIPA